MCLGGVSGDEDELAAPAEVVENGGGVVCVVLLGEDEVACGLEGVTFAFEFVMLVFEGVFEAAFCDGLFEKGIGGGFECVGDGGIGIFE